MFYLSTLGKRIKEFRLKRGYTQSQMAEKLGMTEANFSSYERDKSMPPSEKLSQISSILGASTDYLLFGKLTHLDKIRMQSEFLDDTIKSSSDFEDALKYLFRTIIKYEGLINEEQAITYGLDGLKRAYEYYDPSKGASFSTFVQRCIENEIILRARQDGIDLIKGLESRYRQEIETETIAAHHDGEDWTKEELEEIEQFKEFVRMRRKQRNKG
ncbi:hypothetical protein PALA111701_25390 [Paenibacillus lactis]